MSLIYNYNLRDLACFTSVPRDGDKPTHRSKWILFFSTANETTGSNLKRWIMFYLGAYCFPFARLNNRDSPPLATSTPL